MTRYFGKYELLERIGKGGMAEVFLARSVGAEGLEKRLVIKKILPDLASDDRFVEMFIDEAKIAMGLNHPNIVQVYDFGKVGDDYFLAMEYVDGVELRRVLETAESVDEPMPVGNAVYVAGEVARGLDYLHNRENSSGQPLQLVHRDISPENLMISWDGAVKIVDFGIASTSRAAKGEESGELRGKYRYMSPEEARGDSVDARSDLFSLGAVLFEMVCNRQLFRGNGPREILDLVASAVVPEISTLNPEIPGRLEHVIYKTLSSRPDRRYQDARSLRRELTKVLHDMAEIYDGATVRDYLEKLDERLEDEDRQLAPVGGPGRSGSTAGWTTLVEGDEPVVTTPVLADSDLGLDYPPEIARERKAVVAVAGSIYGITDVALSEYRHIVESIAYKNNAVVERVDETGFVLLVGIPVSDENDADRAVQMAFELDDAISARSLGLEGEIAIRLGAATAEVLFEENHQSDDRHYDWSLQAASLPRLDRLVEIGDESEITVDTRLYRRVRRSFDCTVMERSLEDGESVYRIEGAKSPSTQIRELRRSFQSFYGREIPRRRLKDRIRQTFFEQRARALVFIGPAGIGKSTLVEEFLGSLNRRDLRVVRGVASPLHRDVPLASAAALFAQLLDIDVDETSRPIAEVRSRIEELFSNASERERDWLVDAVARVFTTGASGRESRPDAPGTEGRRHLFPAIRRLMNRLAVAEGPLVIAIDDIHNVDPVMLSFAAEYFDRSQRVPVFLIGTGRDAGPHTETRCWESLRESRNVSFENLEELAPQEAERMVRDLLAARQMESDRLVDIALEQAGGNPLYIHEVVERLVDQQDVVDGRDDLDDWTPEELLPANLEGLIRARIDQLSVDHKEVLKRVSRLPSPFTDAQAQAVCDVDVSAAVDQLVGAQMLEIVSVDEDERSFRFADAVTREVAGKMLVAEEAEKLHGRIAEVLIGERERADEALIAGHLEKAGDHERALDFYEEALDEAFRQYGAQECLRLCDRILEHPEADRHRRFRALLWRHRALEATGDEEAGRRTLEELEELAPVVGAPHEECDVALRRASWHVEQGEYDAARRAADRACEMARNHGETLEMANAWRVEAVVELGEGNRDRALALIDRAIASLNVGGDRRARETMIEAYNARGVILRQSGRHREALEAYETALEAIEHLGSTTLERQLLLNSGLALAYIGQFSEAKRRYERSLEACRRLGHRRDEALVLVNLGHLYQILGRYDRSVSCVRRGIVLGRRSGTTKTVADGEITLGLTLLEEGDLEGAEERIVEGLELAESIPNAYLAVCALLGLCQLDLARGGRAAAREAVERARSTLDRCRETGLMWGVAVAEGLVARGLDRLEQTDEALEHSRSAVELLDEVELLGTDRILVTHAGLLEGRPGAEVERRRCIQGAVDTYRQRLEAIDDEDDRQAFFNRPVNRRIREIAGELGDDDSRPVSK